MVSCIVLKKNNVSIKILLFQIALEHMLLIVFLKFAHYIQQITLVLLQKLSIANIPFSTANIRCVICEDSYYRGLTLDMVYSKSQNQISKSLKFLQCRDNSTILRIPIDYVLEYADGYKVIYNYCRKYCDSNCLMCEENKQKGYCYYEKCGLNRYKQPISVLMRIVIAFQDMLFQVIVQFVFHLQKYEDIDAHFNYEYYNEIGLQQISLILKINSVYANRYLYTLSNDLKENEISGRSIAYSLLNFLSRFLRVMKQQLNKQCILFELHQNQDFEIKNSLQVLALLIQAFILTNLIQLKLYIVEENNLNYNLHNILIYDKIFKISSIFQLNKLIQTSRQIIKNCQIVALKSNLLFFFSNFRKKIIIDYLSINSCQFQNSSIIRFNFTSFYCTDMIIKQCEYLELIV
ncbi:unnamed protein product [Paramecium pentaurelia]|uniref:Transmembrane protein n=1 Tax=Paramecium pentaurelia TaxID=43138 RepID=A0A8S1XT00_9CILI|nr:unnamed protein product [Paramecium pentaurelia]